jgi:hypothetical protein
MVIRRTQTALTLFFGLALFAGSLVLHTGSAAAANNPSVDPSFRYGKNLTDAEQVGADIWFNATAGNARFFTYVYQQRLGVMIDWYRVLQSNARDERFHRWGLINDPDCCKPGDPNCPATSYSETYGFDYCPGDDELLQYVGKTGYRDPACDLKDVPLAQGDPHGPNDQRQSACDLEFGTSTGALGLRKFPNPKFDKVKWLQINGGHLDSWDGYTAKVTPRKDREAPAKSHLIDGSIEPPYRIGMSCGACHIAFDPLNPPKDPIHPKWENLSGTVGNQYGRFAQILGSGMAPNTIEYQIYGHSRPGAVDTSAIPNDQVNNAGTMNALINLAKRPLFEEDVVKWRKTNQCPAGGNERTCWCEPGKDGKCWERSRKKDLVHHILKGGEDSIGALEAIQRVYFNIGSCSEEGWVNHLTDMRQLDPTMRGFGQTPFDIGQVRRDCPQFRAIEDRLDEVLKFLLTGAPADLYQARGLKNNAALIEQLNKEFGKGAVEQGRAVFASKCASCHSSQNAPFEKKDFRTVSTDPKDKGIRIDWLGNDKLIPVSEVATNRSRALHSNHMKGRVWEEYGSESLRAKPGDPQLKEPSDGGRGYYRNISLLSLWAYAPFMHNNAVGPEVCGGSPDDHYHSPYVDTEGKPLASPPPCWVFDPSVEGRFKLYKASMKALLNPSQRIPKVTGFNSEVTIRLFPKLGDGKIERFIDTAILFPVGTPAARIGNFRHKELVGDLVMARVDFDKLTAKYVGRYGPEKGKQIAKTIQDKGTELLAKPGSILEAGAELREVYSNSLAVIENDGHRFGEDLSEEEKDALTAFLATL